MKTAIFFNDSGDQITRRTMGAYKIADMMRSDGWTVEVLDWIAGRPDINERSKLSLLPGFTFE